MAGLRLDSRNALHCRAHHGDPLPPFFVKRRLVCLDEEFNSFDLIQPYAQTAPNVWVTVAGEISIQVTESASTPIP